ncbi:ABC transporter ATP-binding protein [Blastococcus sp. PRF04-17]|uniref:ABC transporter ATP-binding protein n=1 Tax=Blastococcus sp. PRF04-17 TaxID=2933797 RepID=UPI001FF14C27|nr:ABC transporter ATP-binding protein [Blastococcus sp. PRF04-17]UOY02249.1 ABC transporter ATP-binding protein [Blastococcus sp. PRF04-17]
MPSGVVATGSAGSNRPTPVVDIRGASKRFATTGEDVVALTDIDLSVAAGEFVCLIGPSGCGKSTLLNLVGGLLRPSGGRVEIGGRPVTGPPAEVGMMFQKPVLLEWRTVRENVLLPIEASAGRRGAKASRERADELLGRVGLEKFEERYPNELSGGMQQRAAICRMLISDPNVLLLDEPFGALDELTRERLNLELARIVSGTDKAALLVTHNIIEGVFLSDRVVVMSARPGRIVDVVDVPLSRPRSLDVVTTPEFTALVARVRQLLELGHDDDPGRNR